MRALWLFFLAGVAYGQNKPPHMNTKICGNDEAYCAAVDSNNRVKVDAVFSTLPVVTSNQGTPTSTANAWPVKLTDGTTAATINSLGQLEVSAPAIVDTNNSSSTPLGAGATFTGTATDILRYSNISVQVFSNVASATNGFMIEFSSDGTNWDTNDTYTVNAGMGDTVTAGRAARFMRVKYTNGASGQASFRLHTILHPTPPKSSTHRISDSIDAENDAELVKATLAGQRPDGAFGNVPLTRDNYPRISIDDVGLQAEARLISADRSIFGQGIVSNRVSKLTFKSDVALNNNDVTTGVTGSGSVVQGTGVVALSTGTTAASSASIVTNQTIRYAPGREIYGVFAAAFTAGVANSNQRAGLFNSANGMFFGYQGNVFGITVRMNSVDTFTALASANGDPLTGSMTSLFTRMGVPEALNPARLNVYRIRFGWVAGAPTYFEILAPDGRWVRIHTILQPNTSTTPSTLDPNLPVRYESVKTAGSTNVVLTSGSWDAGTVEDAGSFAPEDVKGRKYVAANIGSGVADATVYTVSAGRTLRVTGGNISLYNSNLGVAGLLQIRDGSSGTILFPMTISPSTNQGASSANIPFTLPTGLRFTNSVYADVVSGSLTYSVFFTGYEADD